MSYGVYLGLNILIGSLTALFIYYALIPAFKKDVGLGAILSLILLVPFIITFGIHKDGIKSVDRQRLSPSEYKVVKTQRSVTFVTSGEPIKTDKAFIYNNAEDTSRVQLYKVTETNYFNEKHNQYYEIISINKNKADGN